MFFRKKNRALKIDLVFNDIDGCFGEFVKPKTFPGRQSLEGHLNDLKKIKSAVDANPEVKFAACTGRSLYLAEDIIIETGMNALSVLEMGQVIHDPSTGATYSLLELVKPELVDISQKLRDFIQSADKLFFPFSHANIKRRKDNKHMLTYEFLPKKISRRKLFSSCKELITGKIEIRTTAEEIFSIIYPNLPNEVKQGIQAGKVKFAPSTSALDIRMDIDKGHGIDHILHKLQRTGERCLGIGDSYHSDIDMLKRCEFKACPGNSDEKLKDYVSDRKGYIARENLAAGIIEIYRHFIV